MRTFPSSQHELKRKILSPTTITIDLQPHDALQWTICLHKGRICAKPYLRLFIYFLQITLSAAHSKDGSLSLSGSPNLILYHLHLVQLQIVDTTWLVTIPESLGEQVSCACDILQICHASDLFCLRFFSFRAHFMLVERRHYSYKS